MRMLCKNCRNKIRTYSSNEWPTIILIKKRNSVIIHLYFFIYHLLLIVLSSEVVSMNHYEAQHEDSIRNETSFPPRNRQLVMPPCEP